MEALDLRSRSRRQDVESAKETEDGTAVSQPPDVRPAVRLPITGPELETSEHARSPSSPTHQHGNLPDSRDGNLPDSRDGNLPDSRHGNLPDSRDGNLPDSRHGNLPDSRDGNLPDSRDGNLPDSRHGNLPDSRYGNLPDSRHGNLPDSRHGNLPDSRHGNRGIQSYSRETVTTPDIQGGDQNGHSPECPCQPSLPVREVSKTAPTVQIPNKELNKFVKECAEALKQCQMDSSHQHSHELCKWSETAEEGNKPSEGEPSQDAKEQFFNNHLSKQLYRCSGKIKIALTAYCRHVLEEFNLDLGHVIKLRERGACMETFERLLELSLQKAVMAISSETIEHDLENVQSMELRKVLQPEHSHQQTFSELSQNTQEPKDISNLCIKREPLCSPFHQRETEKQNTGSDSSSRTAENGNPRVSTTDGLKKKTVCCRKEVGGTPSTECPPAVNRDRQDSTRTGPHFKTETPHPSQRSSEKESTADRGGTSPPSVSFQDDAEPKALTDRRERGRKHRGGELSDDITAVEDAEQLLDSQVVDTTASVPGAEEEDAVQMTQAGVTLLLLKSSMWRDFSEAGTEMIINRSGRRMFPYVSIRLKGLEDGRLYGLEMDVVPADSRRYKFIDNSWTAVGIADSHALNRPYAHPESPNTGEHWMSREIHFTRIKLTNNKESCEGNMLLHSMHKYVVQITVKPMSPLSTLQMAASIHFRLALTTFIAVTAYQNDTVTKLKIRNNPFAKAFRDCNLPVNFGGRNMNKRGLVDNKPWEVTNSWRHDNPFSHPPVPSAGMLGGTAPKRIRLDNMQQDESRMVTPHRPYDHMMWVTGLPLPSWGRVRPDAIHPYLLGLPHPTGPGVWPDPSKRF